MLKHTYIYSYTHAHTHTYICIIYIYIYIYVGIITRVAYIDPIRDYWIQCFDEEQGEEPYYYNTYSQETTWKKNGPWAFRLFCGRKAIANENET